MNDHATQEKSTKTLTRLLASRIGRELAGAFPQARVTPSPEGPDQVYRIGGDVDVEKTHVGVWDDRAGLVLGVSIKALAGRDMTPDRFTETLWRHDLKLGHQADGLHRRQPFAYLVAVIILPLDSTWDAHGDDDVHSSFAHAVFTFRERSGRKGPDSDRFDLFEKVFIGLLDAGAVVGFFDVDDPPRRNQPPAPANLVSLEEMSTRIVDDARTRHLGCGPDRFVVDDLYWRAPSGPAD